MNTNNDRLDKAAKSTTCTHTSQPALEQKEHDDDAVPATVVDVGVNLTHRTFRTHWEDVVQRAIDAGVTRMILMGTSMKISKESLKLAETWYNKDKDKKKVTKNLLCTVGIHPHDAKTFEGNNNKTIDEMRSLIKKNSSFVVAIGECGLDFDRNFSSKEDQIHAFREQVNLAFELQMPLFLHERNAHQDLVRILDEVQADAEGAISSSRPLPPIVVHCFTGTHEEAQAYLKRGYFIGFTGAICKKERGAHLRALLPDIPLDRIMIETDAPFMSFIKGKGGRRQRPHSEPAHAVGVAKQLSSTLGISLQQVCSVTTATATRFFRLDT